MHGKVLKSLNTTNGQLSLNFQVAQPTEFANHVKASADKIRHAPHSLEEKLPKRSSEQP